jgi:hypothetical protein
MSKKPFWVTKYGPSDLKNCSLIDNFGFYIPNHQDLSESNVNFICDIVNG